MADPQAELLALLSQLAQAAPSERMPRFIQAVRDLFPQAQLRHLPPTAVPPPGAIRIGGGNHQNGFLIANGEPLAVADADLLAQAATLVAAFQSDGDKQTEQELSRLATVIEQLGESVVITDRDGNIIYVNPFFEQFTGYTADEAIGRNPNILNSGQQDDDFYRDMWATIKGGKTWKGVFINKRKDGSLFYEEATIFPVRNSDGELISFAAIKRDISDQRAAEQERARLLDRIQHQAQQMQEIIAAVPEGVLVLGQDGRILRANPVASGYLKVLGGGRSPGHFLETLGDRSLPDLLVPPEEGLHHEIRSGDRPERVYEAVARPVALGEQRQGHVLILRDVTRQRDMQERAQQQEKLAVVGQLAAGIAHDFNNIMAVITLYAQLIRKDPGLSLKSRERLHTITAQSEHAAELIQQILDFGRRSVIARQPLNLVPFVKELARLLERTLPENIGVDVVAVGDDLWVQVDPTRIQQALLNLAINARDAMLTGGTLTFTIDVPANLPPTLPEGGPGPWARIVVGDTGGGIRRDVLPHIFEPFFTTKPIGEGSGLGLAQVYGIVRQHGGHIDVQSQPGIGATFSIYLPVADPSSARRDDDDDDVIQGHGQLLLLVEDDAQAREALAQSLDALSYRVVTAAHGLEALALLEARADEVALVISDLVMPQMGGRELWQHMHEAFPTIPVLLISGYPLGNELADLEQRGELHWLQKPIGLEELARAVGRLLPAASD